MRFLLYIGILVTIALPANATERMTVAQLEALLSQAATKPQEIKPDTRSADEIA